MLLSRRDATVSSFGSGRFASEPPPGIEISDVLAFLRRQMWMIGGVAALCILLALSYILSAVPRYTADVLVLIEPQRVRLLQGQPTSSDLGVESSLVDSQVEVAQSGRVLKKIIRELNLAEDPELAGTGEGLVSSALSGMRAMAHAARDLAGGLFSAQSPPIEASPAPDGDDPPPSLLENLRQNLTVRRVGLTYVLRISYTSQDPVKAAHIANQVALAYVDDELRAKYDTSKQAALWLEDRVRELREQAVAADRAVQRFRTEQNMAASESQIQLRELERDARTSASVYEGYLTRLKEAAQQQSFPVTEARIISAAERPLSKSHPRGALILGGALCLGLVAGVSAGLLRERLDRTFRTGEQAARDTGMSCLGLVPREGDMHKPLVPPGQSDSRLLSEDLGILRYAADEPWSRFADGIRSIKVAIDAARLDRTIKVIGIVSAVAEEGTSTVASNLAQSVAQSGQSALLIDADLRTGSLTRQLIGSSEAGLADVLIGSRRLADVLWWDPRSNLAFLPAGSCSLPNSSDLLGSTAMREFLSERSADHDLIFIDLPPLAVGVDVRAAVPMVDAFVLVIAWGQTSRDIVIQTLANCESVHDRVLGCVLNKVDVETVRKLDPRGGGYHVAAG